MIGTREPVRTVNTSAELLRASADEVESSIGTHLSPEAFLSLGSMEGLLDPVVTTKAPAPAAPWIQLAPGYALSIGVAVFAYILHALPFAPFTVWGETGARHPISAPIVAILVGLLMRNFVALPDAIKAGCKSAIKTYIPVAVVLTGGTLNFGVLSGVGMRALFIVVMCIIIALAGGYYIGRLCRLNARTSMLLGAGTAICGNSAIVATAPLIDAKDDDIVLSVGAVNLFGLVTMLAWPFIGGWLAMSSEAFGVWAGSTIHAVPQAVAAGFSFSPEAGALATLVKLVRVACLAPMVFVLAILHAQKHANDAGGEWLTVRYARLVPWFVWGFVVLAMLNTAGFLPTLTFVPLRLFAGGEAEPVSVSVEAICNFGATMLLTMDMAAVGLEVNVRQLASVGGKALLAGAISTAVVALASLLLTLVLV